MDNALKIYLATISPDELWNYVDKLLEQINTQREMIEELKAQIADYTDAIDNLADAIGNANGDLVGDELIDY